ncbi:unnamed protein product [Thlaspi arvense]|uniref:Ubiquitin-like protease family profile domain-containing protein n=1 Tax=Thlaspi arvense TaxID=13288 RepID=A0AAU9SR11_THLAR|nr:unnamed protein product [Thlaspi arvense]
MLIPSSLAKRNKSIAYLRHQFNGGSMRLCGFPLVLQLLTFCQIPALLSKLKHTAKLPSLIDLPGVEIPTHGSVILSDVHKAEFDHNDTPSGSKDLKNRRKRKTTADLKATAPTNSQQNHEWVVAQLLQLNQQLQLLTEKQNYMDQQLRSKQRPVMCNLSSLGLRNSRKKVSSSTQPQPRTPSISTSPSTPPSISLNQELSMPLENTPHITDPLQNSPEYVVRCSNNHPEKSSAPNYVLHAIDNPSPTTGKDIEPNSNQAPDYMVVDTEYPIQPNQTNILRVTAALSHYNYTSSTGISLFHEPLPSSDDVVCPIEHQAAHDATSVHTHVDNHTMDIAKINMHHVDVEKIPQVDIYMVDNQQVETNQIMDEQANTTTASAQVAVDDKDKPPPSSEKVDTHLSTTPAVVDTVAVDTPDLTATNVTKSIEEEHQLVLALTTTIADSPITANIFPNSDGNPPSCYGAPKADPRDRTNCPTTRSCSVEAIRANPIIDAKSVCLSTLSFTYKTGQHNSLATLTTHIRLTYFSISLKIHYTKSCGAFDNNFLLQLAKPKGWTTAQVLMSWFRTKHMANANREVVAFCDPSLIGYFLAKERNLGSIEILDPLPKFKCNRKVATWMHPICEMLPYAVNSLCPQNSQSNGLLPYTWKGIDDIYKNERCNCWPIAVKFMELHAAGDPDPGMCGLTYALVDDFCKQYAMDIYRDLVIPLYLNPPA